MSLKKDKEVDKQNPFPNEFRVKNIANRAKELTYEELEKLDESEVGEPVISEQDITEMLIDKPEEAQSKPREEYKKYKTEDSGGSSLIKSRDAKDAFRYTDEELIRPDDEVPDAQSNRPFDSKEHGEIEKEVIKSDVDYDEEAEKEINYYESTDKLEREQKRMKKDFSDFIKSPRIAGYNKSREHKNLFTKEDINDDNSTVELVDSPEYSEIKRENSMIEINRDSNGEIISIVVYCKCGEKTVINLDYYDPDLEVEDDNAQYTSIINDEPEDEDLS